MESSTLFKLGNGSSFTVWSNRWFDSLTLNFCFPKVVRRWLSYTTDLLRSLTQRIFCCTLGPFLFCLVLIYLWVGGFFIHCNMALIYLGSLCKEGAETIFEIFCQRLRLRSFGLGIIKGYFMSKETGWLDCFDIDNRNTAAGASYARNLKPFLCRTLFELACVSTPRSLEEHPQSCLPVESKEFWAKICIGKIV